MIVWFFTSQGRNQTEDLDNGVKRGYIIPVGAGISNHSSTGIYTEQIRSLSSRILAKPKQKKAHSSPWKKVGP